MSSAQSNDTADAEQAELASIERIVVTADLLQRDLSELPASVFVLNEESIKVRQALHLQDLIGMVPNLNFSSGASRGKFIQIRGIGERSQFAEPINPSIGLLLDDIDISGIGGLATIYDLAQVEVLSGPQSVATGVNSVGGIVKLVSNAPTDELYASVNVSYGQFNESRLAGTYSNNLSDNVSTRVSIQQTKSDGFVTNDFLKRRDTNGIDETTATAITTISLNENSDLDIKLYKFDINNGYDAFSLDNTVTLSDQPGFDRLDATAGSLKYNYRFDEHEIQLTAFSLKAETEYGYDEDWTFVGIHPDGYSSIDFYQRDISRTGIDFKLASIPQLSENSYLIGANITHSNEDLLRENTFLEDDYMSTYQPTNQSIFGQYVYALNDKAKITGAARLERFNADFEDYLGSTKISDTLVAASVAIDYKLSSNLVFASISRGYKAGGFNIDDRLDATNRSYEPEYNMNYELGIKGRAYDGMANLNLTFFYMQRNDAQVNDSVLFNIDNTGASSFADAIGNADTGKNKGIEFSGTWDIADNWYVQTNIGYLDATFGDYTKINGEFVELQQQAHAPYYTAYLASTWQVSNNLSWFIDLDIKDDFRLGINHEARAPFAAVLNSELTWRSMGEHVYSITLWVKNITDRAVVTRGFGSFPNDPRNGYSNNGPYLQFGQPNQIGITFNYEWE
ncbi:MAG: outer membrane receptor protein involved in Fe transport [Alphaproteobacteria bacterium]|jgi:outer membrane receptor protein involved in Fe transport